jgi:pimeloyl-ACP methyl ester carboxylesterase
MSKLTRLLAAGLLAATGMIATPTAARADDPSWATCSQQTVQVTLSATSTTLYNLVGRLCLRTDSLRGSRTVELMVPGMTYDQNAFNPSLEPNTYSYVFAATSRGYSTFVIDRIGTGLSGKPAPDLVTTQSHAHVVGQIVQKLRAGTIGGRAFSMVVGVGHSFGAAILQYLAATSTVPAAIPDYLVLGSFLTASYAPTLTLYADSMYPATSDPKFASSGLPTGYITTTPGSRDDLFFRPAGAAANMIAHDETVKSLSTPAERSTIFAAKTPAVLAAIQRPVLIVVGQYDALYCDTASGLSCANAAAVVAREQANFTHARACLSAYVVLDAGHTYMFHNKARDAYNFSHDWVDRYTFSGTKNANGCVV